MTIELTYPQSRVQLLMRIHPEGRVEFEDAALVLDHQGTNCEPVLLSHAHSDHAVKKGRVIATPVTTRLIKVRYGINAWRALDYLTPLKLGKMKLTLYPAGHILGSAQVLIETPETNLLYSGDIKLRKGYSSEHIEIPRAENLLLEATFGIPLFQWPKREKLEELVFDFVENSRRKGYTPVFMAYSLGKSQELLSILAKGKVYASVSESVWRMCKVYEEFGVNFGNYRLYRNERSLPGALVVPAQKARYLEASHPRFALVSGWAMLRQHERQVTPIPLSDHADFAELLRYVDKVKPTRVWTTHGYARELAAVLRRRGYKAEEFDSSSDVIELTRTAFSL